MPIADLPKTVANLRQVSVSNLRPVTLPDGTKHQLTEFDWSRLLRRSGRTENGCWLWAGSRLPSGYGKFSIKRTYVYTHRLAYMIFVGDIPEGLHMDHLCRNPPCYNPAHLEPVTCAENVGRSPIHPAAINASKTECIRGHELSGDNLLNSPSGYRVCRACSRLSNAKQYAEGKAAMLASKGASAAPSREGTYCRNGHELTIDNIKTSLAGQHKCRQCLHEKSARRAAKAKAERAARRAQQS